MVGSHPLSGELKGRVDERTHGTRVGWEGERERERALAWQRRCHWLARRVGSDVTATRAADWAERGVASR